MAKFDNLTQRLNKVVKTLRGQARLTEENIQDALREVRMALLEADVGLPVVKDFIAKVKERAMGQEVIGSLTPGQALIGVVNDALIDLIGGSDADSVQARQLSFATQPPAIILLAGLQGAGKTTTAGKLSAWIGKTTKKKVLLASADVYRPAAIDQLRTLAKQLSIDFYESDSKVPDAIAAGAKDHAKRHYYDVLIFDTAGRLAIDADMMDEIKRLHASLVPIETLFVVDAMQGQDAVNVAKAFNEALPLTGVVLTKLDGDSRGGAALSVRAITGKPIKFVGVSEKLDGLEPFHPDRMASRILGMGDVLSLIEEATQKVDQVEAMKMAEKFKKGKGFDLEDFKSQLIQMRKMGGVAGLMDKLPAELTGAMQGQDQSAAEKQMRRTEGIINSMTVAERRNPDLLKASRKRRIASGAGVQVQEVNRLLKQFEDMQKMMKQMQKMGGLGKLMKGMGALGGMGGGLGGMMGRK
jgi:signal recognition particle subunit SRP54